jgi:hypothetical protein
MNGRPPNPTSTTRGRSGWGSEAVAAKAAIKEAEEKRRRRGGGDGNWNTREGCRI